MAKDIIHNAVKNALIYEQLFQRPSIKLLVEWYKLAIIVVNIVTEEIKEWID